MSRQRFESWLFGRWGFLTRAVAAWFRDVIWPEGAFCCACGRISDGEALCESCRQKLYNDGFFRAWDRIDPAPDFPAWSLRPYDGVARLLVLRLKYNAEACAVKQLVSLMLPLPENVSFSPETIVTWVTMPESRRRDRGIDHGRLLAEAVAEKLSLPCRQLLLRRDSMHEKRQVTLTAHQRSENLRGAFVAKEPITFPVLLVDDVRTTGNTLLRCAEALRAAGADRISALTMTSRK